VGPLNPRDANRHVELEREGAEWTCVRAPREFWRGWLGKPDGTWEFNPKEMAGFFCWGGSWCDFQILFLFGGEGDEGSEISSYGSWNLY